MPMRRNRTFRMRSSLISSALFSSAILLATACDSDPEQRCIFNHMVGEMQIEPRSTSVTGTLKARIDIRVYLIGDGCKEPLEGATVEFFSSRNTPGETVDIIVQPYQPTDVDGWTAGLLRGTCPGEAFITATADGAGLCESWEDNQCTPLVGTAEFTLSCLAGLDVCGCECVDLQNDDGNCGVCGNVCEPAFQKCAKGRCENAGDVDLDGDGYVGEEWGGDDCDDANPEINPGEAEGPMGDSSCADGIDNECDDWIDGDDPGCRRSEPGICSDTGWCWENPLPQGGTLRTVWAYNANNVWAAGDDCVIIYWDGVSWTKQLGGAGPCELEGLWGFAEDDVWVVGSRGSLNHWNGSEWTYFENPLTARLRDVWGSSPDDVWAVGDSGTVLHWDGAGWSEVSIGTSEHLFAVWGSAANDVWIAGDDGIIMRGDGSGFSKVDSGFSYDYVSVWGFGSDDVWLLGSAGPAVHWDGETFTEHIFGADGYAYDIWGPGTSSVWAVGVTGDIFHWNGAYFWSYEFPTSARIYSVFGTSEDNVWAVGEYGLVLHWDGSEWSGPTHDVLSDVWDFWGSSPNDVWAVGTRGAILHWNGSGWSSVESGTDLKLSGVWGAAADDVWAVGGDFHEVGLNEWVKECVILHWDGISWSGVENEIEGSFSGVWGNSSTDIWAVGTDYSNGIIFHWDGATWSNVLVEKPSVEGFYRVWGSGPYDVWAVGGLGSDQILHWNGASWSSEPSGIGEYGGVHDIWGSAPDDVWATSESGIILHWDGSGWTRVEDGIVRGNATGIWGSAPDDVWAAVWDQYDESILHFNGTSWSVLSTGNPGRFGIIWGVDARNVWMGGTNGAILRLWQ